MAHSWWSSPAMVGAILLSTSFHAVPVGQALRDLVEVRMFIRDARTSMHDFLWTSYEVELVREPPKEDEKPKEPEPEPEPEPEAAPAPKPAVAPKATTPAEAKEVKEQPPAAAQAGQTLTAKEDPSAPVDFTDFSMAQGKGDTYAGGVTAADGTSKDAVKDKNAKGGVEPGGKGTGPVASAAPAAPKFEGPDLSRPALPASRGWNCPFPPEADADDINVATVTIAVTIRPDGSPQSVKVLNDPGHGFGRAARTCALSQRYNSAFDRAGLATTGTTPPFPVRFER